MGKLTIRPPGLAQAFVQGAAAAGFSVGLPATISMLFMAGVRALGIALLLSLFASLAAGLAMVLWRWIQHRAYDHFTNRPDF